jgi:hypothetical protein
MLELHRSIQIDCYGTEGKTMDKIVGIMEDEVSTKRTKTPYLRHVGDES